jgi:hypothetical protein
LYSTWIGGSILAGLSTFRKMYVTIDDWHESKFDNPMGLSIGISIDMAVTNRLPDPDIIHQKFA